MSDDAVIAEQIGRILVQLRQQCPSSHLLRLDAAVSNLDATSSLVSKASVPGAGDVNCLVVIVLSPDVERAMAVIREVRRRPGARVLAVGPTTNTKVVLRAMREGASEYLDQGDLATELPDALKRLDSAEKPGQIIGFLSPVGGSGNSTLAANVAATLAQKHQSCVLIDLKLEAGDLAPLLNLRPNHTLSDLCQNIGRLDLSLLQGCLERSESGVQLLAAPARIADAPAVTAGAIEAILSLVCRHFPLVVLDIDHSFRAEQQSAILSADVLALVIRLDFVSFRNGHRTLDFLKELGVGRDKIRVVANMVGRPGQLSAAQAEDSLGVKISHFIPDDPNLVNRAGNDGMPFVLQSHSSKVARSLADLATSLIEPSRKSG